MYILVAPLHSSFDDIGITYSVPEDMEKLVKAGSIVTIELRGKQDLAVVLQVLKDAFIDFGESEVKDIRSVHSLIDLPPAQRMLLTWVSQYYFSLIHSSAALFFPKNLQQKILKDTLKYKEIATGDKAEVDIPELTESQERCYQEIKKLKGKPILFWGVTGSGKTSIYMQIVADNLAKGKQTLVMTPEIILGNQIGERFKKVFGKSEVSEVSSALSDAKKTDVWLRIFDASAKIIIGTRSTLFYPYQNLATIIIDEEHDKSYSSDSGPRYDGREVAIKLAELTGAQVILASGTPSITSMFKATKKVYHLVTLLEKYEREETR